MDVIRRVLVALALSLALLAGRAPVALADAAPAAGPTPEQVRQLLGLLADPAVRDWIARGAPAPPAADSPPPPAQQPVTLGQYLRERLVANRPPLIGLAPAAPAVPDELAHAWLILSLEFEEQGLLSVLLLIAAFAALGFGIHRLFWHLTRGWRRRVIAAPLDTVRERLSIVFQRLLYGVLNVAAFGLGSVGAFLAFSWPPLLQEIVLAGLLVLLVIMTAHALGRFALAPGGPRFRVLPMPQAPAEHWFLWLRVIAGYLALEFAILDLLRTLGVSQPVRDLLTLAWGVGGLTLCLVALFRRPAYPAPPPASGCPAPGSAPGSTPPGSASRWWPAPPAPSRCSSSSSPPPACRPPSSPPAALSSTCCVRWARSRPARSRPAWRPPPSSGASRPASSSSRSGSSPRASASTSTCSSATTRPS